MRAPFLAALALLLASLAAPRPVVGASPASTPLEVEVSLHPPLDAQDVLAHLERELGGRKIVSSSTPADGADSVTITQREPDVAQVSVDIELSSERRRKVALHTEIALGDTPEPERARALAIAVVELLRAWDQPQPSQPPQPPRAGSASQPQSSQPRPPALPPSPEPRRSGLAELHASAGFRAQGTPAWGGAGAGLHFGPTPWLRVSAGFDGLHTVGRTGDATIDLWLLAPRVGVAWVPLRGDLELGIGPVFDLGIVRAQGSSPMTGADTPVWDWVATVRARAALWLPLSSALCLVTALEVGVTVRELELLAFGQRSVTFSGLTGGAELGIALRF
jgi:hypothetical protein